MSRPHLRSPIIGLAAPAALALILPSQALAAIIDTIAVGSGASLSTIQIDFSNGDGYVFEFRYDGAVTGFSALQSIESVFPDFTLVYEDTGFGPLVLGLGVFGTYEYGIGDLWPRVENYWHYWLKDTGDWAFAPVGAGSRALFDGSFDGWVFGTPAAPQPIPAPGTLLVGVVAALSGRRRSLRTHIAADIRTGALKAARIG